MAYGLTTYPSTPRREDLLDFLKDLKPSEFGLTEVIKKAKKELDKELAISKFKNMLKSLEWFQF